MYALNKCVFLLGLYLEMPHEAIKKLIMKKCGCGKGCGQKRGSSGVAYDECVRASLGINSEKFAF